MPSAVARPRLQHWAVTVHADGELVVALESNSLAGRELSSADEKLIERCAHHLLAFIGRPVIPERSA